MIRCRGRARKTQQNIRSRYLAVLLPVHLLAAVSVVFAADARPEAARPDPVLRLSSFVLKPTEQPNVFSAEYRAFYAAQGALEQKIPLDIAVEVQNNALNAVFPPPLSRSNWRFEEGRIIVRLEGEDPFGEAKVQRLTADEKKNLEQSVKEEIERREQEAKNRRVELPRGYRDQAERFVLLKYARDKGLTTSAQEGTSLAKLQELSGALASMQAIRRALDEHHLGAASQPNMKRLESRLEEVRAATCGPLAELGKKLGPVAADSLRAAHTYTLEMRVQLGAENDPDGNGLPSGAEIVPVLLEGVDTVTLRGQLDPQAKDRVDWWGLSHFHAKGVSVILQPADTVELITVTTRDRLAPARLGVFLRGSRRCVYSIEFRPDRRQEAGRKLEIRERHYEPDLGRAPEFPF